MMNVDDLMLLETKINETLSKFARKMVWVFMKQEKCMRKCGFVSNAATFIENSSQHRTRTCGGYYVDIIYDIGFNANFWTATENHGRFFLKTSAQSEKNLKFWFYLSYKQMRYCFYRALHKVKFLKYLGTVFFLIIIF